MLNSFLNCKNSGDCFSLVTIALFILFLKTFLLKYFWNNALVPHITILKPISTLMDSLMLSIGFSTVTALT